MSAKRFTTLATVVIAIVMLVVGALIGVLAYPMISPTISGAKPGLSGTVEIAALLPLSGDLATYGRNDRTAVEAAVEDVNHFLEKTGAKWRLKLTVEDTETKPDVALSKLQSIAARGIKFVIGPMASAGVSQCKGYADSNKIIIISPSSTSPALSIPGDYIFRFCPTDLIQGRAMARVMYDDGIRYIVAVWRGDSWGDGLEASIKSRFQELGGKIIKEIRYDPHATEFSAEASAINDAVSSAISQYGADKVGVLVISFEEAAILFTSLREYPNVLKVKFYGSDGTAKSSKLLKDPSVAEFSMKTKFLNPIFAPTKSEKYLRVLNYVKDKLGREPESYAYTAYDAVWAIAYSLMVVDSYDSEAVKNILPDVTRSLFGASGWIVLDKNGDRAAADYELWVVTKEGGTYKWKWAGTYNQATDSVTWR
ncbi:penicillin-binding protein activator [Candidatus Bathyarchaeota archaeon]|nr:penicillin-binding protein activator [Candidatus Bathyarchaeota archaeon]